MIVIISHSTAVTWLPNSQGDLLESDQAEFKHGIYFQQQQQQQQQRRRQQQILVVVCCLQLRPSLACTPSLPPAPPNPPPIPPPPPSHVPFLPPPTPPLSQVDGPSHFVALAGGGRRPNGATRLKRRLLGRAGCRVVSVPYWEWDACAGPAEQAACLRRLLQA